MRFSDQPNVVETVAFGLFWKDRAIPSAALQEDEWMAIWRTADEVTKEQYRERAQKQMRDFEG